MSALQEELREVVKPLHQEIARLSAAIEALQGGPKSEWVTVHEAAEILKVGPETIRRRDKAQRYEFRRPAGNKILIRRSSLNV